MSKAYPSNLTQDQFELLNDLIPSPKPGGRPREVEMWAILNAIFYILVEGCRWRALPGDFPAWQTVYTYFRNWRKDGTWLQIHDRLRVWSRMVEDRDSSPSEAVIDSQSVKSAAGVHEAVGFDSQLFKHPLRSNNGNVIEMAGVASFLMKNTKKAGAGHNPIET